MLTVAKYSYVYSLRDYQYHHPGSSNRLVLFYRRMFDLSKFEHEKRQGGTSSDDDLTLTPGLGISFRCKTKKTKVQSTEYRSIEQRDIMSIYCVACLQSLLLVHRYILSYHIFVEYTWSEARYEGIIPYPVSVFITVFEEACIICTALL